MTQDLICCMLKGLMFNILKFKVHMAATGIVKVKVRKTIPQTPCDVTVISPSFLFLYPSVDLMHTNSSAQSSCLQAAN